MRITHRVDYGVRVLVALARAEAEHPGSLVAKATLAASDNLPASFIDDILRDLRRGGLLTSRRGTDGGWALNRPADTITVADIIRALEGPLASVRGIRPHELDGTTVEEAQIALWVAVRAALRSVLEAVTVADLAANRLPPEVQSWLERPGAWSADRHSGMPST